jgi:hypothetical protein
LGSIIGTIGGGLLGGGGGAAIGGTLGGMLDGSGGGRIPTQTKSGYGSLFDIEGFGKENPKFLANELPQSVIDIFRSKRPRGLFRDVNQGDLQGAFTPKAIMEIASQFNNANRSAPTMQSASPDTGYADMLQAQNLLQEVQSSNQGQGRQMKPMSQIDPMLLRELAKKAKGAMVGSGSQAGMLYGGNNQPIDLTEFYR